MAQALKNWLKSFFHTGDDPAPRGYKKYVGGLVKWLLCGLAIGLIGGVAGAGFHILVDEAAKLRQVWPWLIWLLPVGGLVIALLYHSTRTGIDTNAVIRAVHTNNPVKLVMAPLIFFSTVVSHLFGASVGREGAALQIGGVIGYHFANLCRVDDRDHHVLVMCGMSAVFAANFGTPVTAAFFSLEVIAVGVIYYAGLVPCLTSSLTAWAVASALGVEPFSLPAVAAPAWSVRAFGIAVLLGLACAALSVIFCRCLHRGEHLAQKWIPNSFIRIFTGGAAAALLVWLAGTGDYCGAGVDVIRLAVSGQARPEDFLMKMALTVLCVCVGFKGGEIIPTIFIGACFGCTAGRLLGFDPGFAAALCAMALFCAMVNCPMTSLILSVELFGGVGLPFFAAAIALSYMMSGSYSLYLEQHVVYSKVKAAYINRSTK